MNSYKALHKQKYANVNFAIIPIRYEDRMAILKWRNEQIYHLRQVNPLTEEDQENYFNTVVNSLLMKTNQIKFCFHICKRMYVLVMED